MSATETPAPAKGGPQPESVRIHGEVALRLANLDQRYTAKRRAVIEALVDAGRPLTIPEVLLAVGGMPMSSAYRNLTMLCDAGVTRRLPGLDDLGRFELAEGLSGHHHHHLVCSGCGTITDIKASDRLERALVDAARQAADEVGFEVTDHRIDLEGRCVRCR